MNSAPRQHTPGPWTVDNQHIHGPDGIRFLAVAGDGAGQANARLIASAPDLLAALQWYVDTYAIPESDHKLGIPHLIAGEQAARAAIAKATGATS